MTAIFGERKKENGDNVSNLSFWLFFSFFLTSFEEWTNYLVRSKFYLESFSWKITEGSRSTKPLPYLIRNTLVSWQLRPLRRLCCCVLYVLSHCIHQRLPVRHRHPNFKDEEVMFKEMEPLARTLPINGCYSQATPAPGMQQDTKGSWQSVILHVAHLTPRNLMNWILPVLSPLTEENWVSGNGPLPVVLQLIRTALIPGRWAFT